MQLSLTLEELFELGKSYATELYLEQMYRKTELDYEPATLDTTLTNR